MEGRRIEQGLLEDEVIGHLLAKQNCVLEENWSKLNEEPKKANGGHVWLAVNPALLMLKPAMSIWLDRGS